jgi:GPH family glycoside/pentoside/hexuronide:cation symporter
MSLMKTQKYLYGWAELGINALDVFLRVHLLSFFVDIVQAPIKGVGFVMALTIFWDAAIDPLVGMYSDRFFKKARSRMILVLIGGVFSALFFYALFHPPSLPDETSKLVFLLVVSVLLSTATTFLSVPYAAMINDFAVDAVERKKLLASKLILGNLGLFLGIGVAGYFLTQNPTSAYSKTSELICMVMLICLFVSSFTKTGVPPAPNFQKTSPIKEIFLNKNFFWLLAGFLILNVALTFNSSSALFYYRLKLKLSEAEIQNVLLLFMFIFTLSIPFYFLLSRWFSPKWILFVAAGTLGLSNGFIYPWLNEGMYTQTLIWASAWGGALAGSAALLELMMNQLGEAYPDHFGFIYGLWKFISKVSRSLSMYFAGLLLDWANVSFPDADTGERLGTLFGPIVGFVILAAAFFVLPIRFQKRANPLHSPPVSS